MDEIDGNCPAKRDAKIILAGVQQHNAKTILRFITASRFLLPLSLWCAISCSIVPALIYLSHTS